MSRLMLSVFKGTAPVSFPGEWVEGIDMDRSFALVGEEARFKTPRNGAFGIRVFGAGPNLSSEVRRLSEEEVEATEWGPFAPPFEPYNVARMFGIGSLIELDKI